MNERERREFGGFSAPTPRFGTKRWRYELTKAVTSAPKFSVEAPKVPMTLESYQGFGQREVEARLLIETLATHRQLAFDV